MKSLFEVTVRSKECLSTVQLVSDSYNDICKQIEEVFIAGYEIIWVKRKEHDGKQASKYIETMISRLSLQSANITIEDKIEDIKWNLAKRHFYTGVIIKATLYLELQARGLIEHSKDKTKITMFGATVKIANISNWSASDVERGYKFISA